MPPTARSGKSRPCAWVTFALTLGPTVPKLTERAMRLSHRLLILGIATTLSPVPLRAQLTGVRAEIMRDLTIAEGKFSALADAMDAEQYEWSPAMGVRTFGQVLLHVAGNNYHLPTTIGIDAPDGVPINDSYQSVVAFEQGGDRDAIIAQLARSFAHVKRALEATPDAEMEREINFFGTYTTVRGMWMQTVVHMSEHLGQCITYARSNGVTPPWSN